MGRLRDMLTAGAVIVAAWPARAENAGAMALALSAAEVGDWRTARDAAVRSGPMAEALIGWQALRAGFGSFQDYLDFVRDNPDWPGLDLLRDRGNAKLNGAVPAADVVEWLGDGAPATLAGSRVLATALDGAAARAERARLWVNAPLGPAEETAMLAEHGAELAPLHAARVESLLDQGAWQAAERNLTRLPDAARALPAARIALQAGRAGVDALIESLPAAAQADPGLMLDRFRWRVRAKLHDGARDLMLAASEAAETLRRPDAWAPMRVDYARLAMRGGDWALAERLAANHHLPADDGHYADLEWLAGYAALKQDQPERALDHFRHLETVVGSAISVSRALYWQGRALEASGDRDGATAAWRKGAVHIGTYYGQLAAEKIGATLPPAFAVAGAGLDSLPDWRGAALLDNTVFRAGLWLLATGRRDEAQQFFLHLAQTALPDDIARMARLMYEARAPWHGLRLSKQAASKGAIFPAAHFPLTGLEGVDLGVPAELVMAIARQESEFNHTVSSHAGAQGLMQVMPDTARMMAARIDEPFQLARLSEDAGYNARLGAAYLGGLRDRFGTSVALTASGYNAGPGRPARWIRDFGDLRRDTDPVDWVELIPFDETRNYVMRVTEALPIYRARIAGHPVPVVPTWDLTGGGLMPPPPLRLTLALSKPPPPRPFIGPVLPAGWTPPVRALVPPKLAFPPQAAPSRAGAPAAPPVAPPVAPPAAPSPAAATE